MPRERTVYLIDGSAQFHRAYFAIRGLATSRGLPTNATYGFTTMLRKLYQDEAPEWVGISFDLPLPTFRHQEYAAYKAHRPRMQDDLAVQLPYVRRVCEIFRLPVIEAPGFDEHRSGRNAWALRLTDDDMQRYNVDQLARAAALLFGRTTYQIWAAFWPSLPDDEPFGRRTNEIAKYVVSNTLTNATWTNTTIIRGDLATEIRALKDRIDGDILCYGSADLVGGLMEADLVDEYRLMLFPIVLGSGKRLFEGGGDPLALGLAEVMPVGGDGVTTLTYRPVAG
jgi:dihydrofolate reductase